MPSIDVEETLAQLLAAGERLDAAAARRLMRDLYRSLVSDQAHRFAAMFEVLLQDELFLKLYHDLPKEFLFQKELLVSRL